MHDKHTYVNNNHVYINKLDGLTECKVFDTIFGQNVKNLTKNFYMCKESEHFNLTSCSVFDTYGRKLFRFLLRFPANRGCRKRVLWLFWLNLRKIELKKLREDKKRYNREYKRFDRCLKKLEKLGLIYFYGSSVRVKFNGFDGPKQEAKSFRGRYVPIPARNNIHNLELLNCVLRAIKNKINSYGPLRNHVHVLGKYMRIKNRNCLDVGLIVGNSMVNFLVRAYGYQQPVSKAHIMRDLEFYKFVRSCKEFTQVYVVSTSWFEKEAYFMLKNSGLEVLRPLNYNLQLPYTTLDYRLEKEEREKERYEWLHKNKKGYPSRPPIALRPKLFLEHVDNGKIKSLDRLADKVVKEIFRFKPSLRELLRAYELMLKRYWSLVSKAYFDGDYELLDVINVVYYQIFDKFRAKLKNVLGCVGRESSRINGKIR